MKSDREELIPGEAPDFEAPAALAAFRQRVEREGIVPRASWTSGLVARLSLSHMAWARPIVATFALLLVLSLASATGVADTVLKVFEPQKVATVRVDPSQLGAIPDPSAYGTLEWAARPSWQRAASLADAARQAGFEPLAPSVLPEPLASRRTLVDPWHYASLGQGKATFRFDEAKAKAAAARVGAAAPPMPASVAQTTLTLVGGPAVAQEYGTQVLGSEARDGRALPELLIVQARAPVVTSNGASVEELRAYALSQPGIPPALAAQIRAIGDPVGTLLVPVGLQKEDAKAVGVRGTQGYLFSGAALGQGIVWVEDGYVLGAFSTVLDDQALIALVNGLR